MSDPTSVQLVIGGLVMPFVIALINQSHWRNTVRGLVAFGSCLGAAALCAEVQGGLNWHDWRAAAILITGSALGMYHLLWKPSGIAPKIEADTTLSRPTPTP